MLRRQLPLKGGLEHRIVIRNRETAVLILAELAILGRWNLAAQCHNLKLTAACKLTTIVLKDSLSDDGSRQIHSPATFLTVGTPSLRLFIRNLRNRSKLLTITFCDGRSTQR